jgi:hypothetical protein
MELASLVRDASETGLDGAAQSLVVVADDQAHAMEATLLE